MPLPCLAHDFRGAGLGFPWDGIVSRKSAPDVRQNEQISGEAPPEPSYREVVLRIVKTVFRVGKAPAASQAKTTLFATL